MKRAFYPTAAYKDTYELSQMQRWATVFMEVEGGYMAFSDIHEQCRWSEEQYAKWASEAPAA